MRTIIVRVFEPGATGDVGLCGFVEEVERGTREHFIGAAQLLDVIGRIAQHTRDHADPQSCPP